MARRRRSRNPLLAKILIISVLAHAIALPILAHFGAFDKIKKALGASDVVMVTVAPEEKPKEKAPVKEAKKARTSAAQKRGASAPAHTSAPRSNVNQPAVVAQGGGAGDGTGPTVEQGSGKAGEVPAPKNPTPPQSPAATAPAPNPTPAPRPAAPVPEPTPAPSFKPVAPAPAPKKAPVYREVEPVYQPEPIIPDSLRQDALDKSCLVELTVSSDGNVASARVAESTGNRELDDLALRTAKTWRFQPATVDGSPTEGRVRLRVEFKVE